ncbi:MAG: hypothetical protein MK077_05450 [Phycisphaerales bacterium]|nr:hypothetical protein [Phycisphaerales bacterium]
MSASEPTPPKLSRDDARAVDLLAAAGFDRNKVDSDDALTDHLDAADALLQQLNAYPTSELSDDDCRTLVDATMARINRAEADRQDRLRMDNHPVMMGRGLRFRVAEGLAVAAVLAMAVATVWSFTSTSRQRSMSNGARRNLSELHAGMTAFEADQGKVPVRTASPEVGSLMGHRNDAIGMIDLGSLVTHQYCDHAHRRNPRRPGAGGNGFSVAVIQIDQLPKLHHGAVILAGDSNPALDGMIQGMDYPAAVKSARWHSRLIDRPSVVFSDGRTVDLPSAEIHGDGIWRVDPGEGPAPVELFLAH